MTQRITSLLKRPVPGAPASTWLSYYEARRDATPWWAVIARWSLHDAVKYYESARDYEATIPPSELHNFRAEVGMIFKGQFND